MRLSQVFYNFFDYVTGIPLHNLEMGEATYEMEVNPEKRPAKC